MTSVHSRFKSILEDIGHESTTYRVQPSTQKILNHFGAEVLVIMSSKKQGNVLHNCDMGKE